MFGDMITINYQLLFKNDVRMWVRSSAVEYSSNIKLGWQFVIIKS